MVAMDAYQTSTERYNTALSITQQSLELSHFFHNTHTFQQCMLQHSSLNRSNSIHSTALGKQVQQQFDYICATPFVNCLTCLVTQYICVPAHTVWHFTKQTWLGKQTFAFMASVFGLWLCKKKKKKHTSVCNTTVGSALKECLVLYSSTHLSCVTVLCHKLSSSSHMHLSPWRWLDQTHSYSVVIIALTTVY